MIMRLELCDRASCLTIASRVHDVMKGLTTVPNIRKPIIGNIIWRHWHAIPNLSGSC